MLMCIFKTNFVSSVLYYIIYIDEVICLIEQKQFLHCIIKFKQFLHKMNAPSMFIGRFPGDPVFHSGPLPPLVPGESLWD